MENVILIVHLILAMCLIGVVLLQRSEGGGLGIGGGGGTITGRAKSTPLGKLTWAFAIGFIVTSISLTILAARDAAGVSVLDQIGVPPATQDGGADSLPIEDLLPPPPSGGPLVPPPAD